MQEKLHGYHIALIVYMLELDVTVFSLPRIVAENLGTNGWIGLILLAFVAVCNIALIQLVYRAGKGRSIYEIAEQSIPKLLLYPVYLLLAIFWIGLGSFIGKKYVLIYQMISFPTTSASLLYISIALLAYYMLTKGIYNMGKAITLFCYMTIILTVLLFYYTNDWELSRFTTYLFQGAAEGHSFKNWLEVYTIFVGYEITLFLFPYSDKKTLFKGVYCGQILNLTIYLILIMLCFGFFSFEQLKSIMYPVINLLSYIELPFLNRLENLVFTLFLFSNVISIALFSWMALTATQRVFPRVKLRFLELGILALSVGISFYPSILRDSEKLLRYAMYGEAGLAFMLPLLLLALLFFQNKKAGGNGGTPA
ncbi:lysylphosphatidylglycerol synthetase-like protein (DUF2156 family) [Paenibacillus phyllosphaerae]|uniref:Lysylphosphatidylglycerol synthetase-like protein (DUF2156 family) n=1 Tax=Paenibacillus phyllosphaerae TaxID=274593 RepID=A0A7W5B0A6_9BACL|nr:GerAB/ArcD/ProY family transporter [Paenibacillus phyllosphaerae]MBB3112095.1 lysylphosphatidylglycerol synthetase-like protein (DUF2156 family) [Paenibacillus phyllosphaerae]